MKSTSALWRALAVLFALSWAVFPGFGLIDLWVTWGDPPWFTPMAGLEAGWGLLMTFMVATPFAFIAVTRRCPAPMVALLGLVGLALLVGSCLALDWRPVMLAAGICAQLAILLLRRTWRRHLSVCRPLVLRVDLALAVLAVLGLPAWVTYAMGAATNARLDPSGGDITIGIAHWPVQAAFALAVTGCTVSAAVWPAGRRVLSSIAGIASCWFGVACLRYPDSLGAINEVWSAMAIVWGVTEIILGMVLTTRSKPIRPLPSPLLDPSLPRQDGEVLAVKYGVSA